jgi:calcium/proton exchanger cax
MLIIPCQTLGLCIMSSGVVRSVSTWNPHIANTTHGLLLTAGALYTMIITFNSSLFGQYRSSLVFLSRGASVMLLTLYGLYQFFRRTHSFQFQREVRAGSSLRTIRKPGIIVAAAFLLCTIWSTYACAIPLLKAMKLKDLWMGDAQPNIPSREIFSFCLLPLLAELAEFLKTCSLSYQGEMDISFEVATTTSIHMLLLVAPICCFFAWCMGISLDLDLGSTQAIILFLNIWLFSIIMGHGRSTLYQGILVCGL